MPQLRWQFIRFNLAMSDDDVREIIKPYEPVRIERDDREGLVCLDGGSYDEEDAMRRRFIAWAKEHERQGKAASDWSFDADAYLRSRGIDPAEMRALMPRERPDRSHVENSYDWVIKHRRVAP